MLEVQQFWKCEGGRTEDESPGVSVKAHLQITDPEQQRSSLWLHIARVNEPVMIISRPPERKKREKVNQHPQHPS